MATILDSLKTAEPILATIHPNLKLLVLFGSRATGEADPSSDWDFAFQLEADRPTDNQSSWFPGSGLSESLCHLLQIPDDKIDLVNLDSCSDILAHFVAHDGQVIYEKQPGEFAQFQQEALKTDDQLKQYRHAQREKVLQSLQRWGV
jgi:uncharacterized protein